MDRPGAANRPTGPVWEGPLRRSARLPIPWGREHRGAHAQPDAV